MAEQSEQEPRKTSRISSKEFADLIVDALEDAGIIRSEDTERAIAIVSEEIDVRRALGDG